MFAEQCPHINIYKYKERWQTWKETFALEIGLEGRAGAGGLGRSGHPRCLPQPAGAAVGGMVSCPKAGIPQLIAA